MGKEELIYLSQSRAKKKTIPWKVGSPDGHGRLSLKGNGDGYIGNVVNGSISHNETLGCLSPAVDSSHPTCIDKINMNHILHNKTKISPYFKDTLCNNLNLSMLKSS